jgi:hypothetical protein
MIWIVLIFSHALFFCAGGLTFWLLTDPRFIQERQDRQFARSRRTHPSAKN